MKYFLIALFSVLLSEVIASDKDIIVKLHDKCYSLLDNNLDSAIILAEQAEKLALQENNLFLEAKSLYIKAFAYDAKQDLGKSFVLNLKALELLNKLKSKQASDTRIEILNNTGLILKQHYVYSEAIKYYDEGIDLAIENGNMELLAPLYYNKALALRHNNQLNEALEIIELSLLSAQKAKDESRVLRGLNQKGLILKDLEEFNRARDTYTEIIKYPFEKKSPEKYLGQAWHNIAVTYLNENNLDKAKKAYQKAILIKEQRNKPEDLFITYQDYSQTLLNLSELNEAYSYAQKCLVLYEHCDLDPDNYKFFNLMSEIAYRQNKPKLVREYSQKYFDENEKFLTQQREILEVKDRYKMEVLTAGFFSELHADQNISLLERVLWTVGILFTCILLITRIYTYLRKRSLSIQITQIKEEGTV
ncbi:tetratricopeptide repeat protein [Marinoscillum pacificum]|uniref:tetratricopeptide repeat protein n=1 Tax=Marinoscillum pacificum TaxID=392723 RepID=UPI0021585BD9|nr:tetratricopeptide repeat protein [Marinoscillum pacificum]